MREKITQSKWYKNFKDSVFTLIEEQKKDGYSVKDVTITIGLYNRLKQELGYDPDNIFGYNLTILEQTDEQFDEEGDMILVNGEPLN